MGCVASKVVEERVLVSKERRRLMKQLLVLRTGFSKAQMDYLQALKNTGATLRQFTESECVDVEILLESDVESELEDELSLPGSPSDLPPPPPPLPPFSPDHEDRGKKGDGAEKRVVEGLEGECKSGFGRNFALVTPFPLSRSCYDIWDRGEKGGGVGMEGCDGAKKAVGKGAREEGNFGFGGISTLAPFTLPSSCYDIGDPLRSEEEDWAETNTEFEKEKEEGTRSQVIMTDIVLNPLSRKSLEDAGWGLRNPGVDSALAAPRSKQHMKKSLAGVIGEIDDYFLKASASGKDVIVLLDINMGGYSVYENVGGSMRRLNKSSKVFSALSWSWSSRSLPSGKDTMECYDPGEPCKPGAHGITLEKIYAEEEKLYKEIKEEENAKLEYERKTLLLQKYESGAQDLLRTEETRSSIEALQYDICCFQQSISEIHATILKLIYEELHPQLIILSSGLMHMWRTMYECHQVQNRIAQQMNHLINHPKIESTTDYHHQSTIQLETEVNGWYISFHNLLNSQREYVQALNSWVQLTDCLVDGQQENNCLSIVQHLCEHWKLGMDHLPDKAAGEAIKHFLSVIHSIVLQQAEEHMLQKKSERLERKLQKETTFLSEMEKKFDSNAPKNEVSASASHPLAMKRAKTEAFKKKVEDEKTKYLISVKNSHDMTLSNLKTSLPNVFQALTAFSSECAHAFEAVNSHTKPTVCHGNESEVCESSLPGVC